MSSTAAPLPDISRPDPDQANANGYQSLDWLCTLIAVLDEYGMVRFVNAALENALGQSRRIMVGSDFATCFAEPALLDKALSGARSNASPRLATRFRRSRVERCPVPRQ